MTSPTRCNGAKWVWFEEYACGCVSDYVRVKRDLVGYCGQHGDTYRERFYVKHKPKERT